MKNAETGIREPRNSLDIIAGRTRFRMVLLDANLRIVFGEWELGRELFAEIGIDVVRRDRLPKTLEDAVRSLVSSWNGNAGKESAILRASGRAVRVCVLDSDGGRYIALFIEPGERRREDLDGARKRYSLTRRQVDVLRHILDGDTGDEIAHLLSIAETTVGDHFKALLKKTRAANRADMIARVLDYRDPLYTPTGNTAPRG